jgi:hypothetical protein
MLHPWRRPSATTVEPNRLANLLDKILREVGTPAHLMLALRPLLTNLPKFDAANKARLVSQMQVWLDELRAMPTDD